MSSSEEEVEFSDENSDESPLSSSPEYSQGACVLPWEICEESKPLS